VAHMSGGKGTLTDIGEALDMVLAETRPLEAEEVPLREAYGRTLATDVVAADDIPPFVNSAMDGYALRGADLAAGRRQFRLIDEVPAGRVSRLTLGEGEAIKIMTGAPLPEGADTVAPIEVAEQEGATVSLRDTVAPSANVRLPGEDVRRGETVFTRGQPLGPAEVGLLASLGFARVAVARRPRVAILATGDELIEVDEPLRPGKIRNSNSYSSYGQVLEAGGTPVPLGIARDDLAETRRLLERALREDVVLTSGGVSVGEFDFVKVAQDELGVQRRFWGVRSKPGKPVAFGVRDGKLVFGAPGNPVAVMVAFELYIRPALLAMQGRRDIYRPHVWAQAEEEVRRTRNRVEVRRCVLHQRDERWFFTTTGPQGSGILRSMALADGLVFVPPNFAGAGPGTRLMVMLLSGTSAERPPFPT